MAAISLTFWRIRVYFAIAMALIVSGPACCGEIDSTMRMQDKRLEKPVTLHARRMCLGEILEQLSAQTRIGIAIDGKDSSSGVEVTVDCSNVPAATVLNVLWACVSARHAEWNWIRQPRSGALDYVYVLSETARAKDKAQRIRDYAQAALEDYTAVMIDLARMSLEERRRNKARLTKALDQDNDQLANSMIENEQVWQQVRFFADVLTPDMQSRVLHGERCKVDLAELSAGQRDHFHILFANMKMEFTRPDGTAQAAPEPASITFFTSDKVRPTRQTVGSVFMDLGGQLGASSIIGGYFFEKAISRAIRKMWILPGDFESDATGMRTVPEIAVRPTPPPTTSIFPDGTRREVPTAGDPHLFDGRLMELASNSNIPLVALLPVQQSPDPGSPTKQVVRDYVDKIADVLPYPMYKWREHVLVVIYPAWFVEDEDTIPYSVVKRFLRTGDGLISLREMVALMTALSDMQAARLSRTYPSFRAAVGWRPLFLLCGKFPEIASLRGTALDTDKIAQIRAIAFFAKVKELADGTGTAIRLTEQEVLFGSRKGINIRAELLTRDRKWVLLGGFVQTASLAGGD